MSHASGSDVIDNTAVTIVCCPGQPFEPSDLFQDMGPAGQCPLPATQAILWQLSTDFCTISLAQYVNKYC